MAAYITVLNYVYSLCVFYYSVLFCVTDVADCPLQRLSAIVIKNIIIIIIMIIIIMKICVSWEWAVHTLDSYDQIELII